MLKSSNVYAFGVFLLIVSVNGDLSGIQTKSTKSNLAEETSQSAEQGTTEGSSDENYKSATGSDITTKSSGDISSTQESSMNVEKGISEDYQNNNNEGGSTLQAYTFSLDSVTVDSSSNGMDNAEDENNVAENSTCGQPPDIDEASPPDLDDEEYAIGTEIKYHCNLGYVSRIPGGFKSVCEFDETTRKAEWTKPKVSCSPRSCGDPGYVTNGRRIGHLFTYPNKIEFECDEGYKLKGLKSRYCQARGEWSGRRLPTCELIHCSEPANIVNGRVSYSSLGYGSELRYECNRGFVLKNHVSRVCTADGKWSDEEPDCIEVTCEEPLPPERGSVQFSDGQSVGSIATYLCEEGTTLVGVSSSKCQENGVWTFDPPKCLRSCIIPEIENGVIGFYKTVQKYQRTNNEFVQFQVGETVKPGDSVVLRCQNGFIPVNITTLRNRDAGNIWCREEVWSKTMQCAPSKCLGVPPAMENGTPVVGENTHGSTIWYQCKPGYQKLEKGHVECVYGTWKGYTPVCGDYRCFVNSLNYPGLILPTTNYLTSGRSFNINCEEGYEKTSSKKKMRCFKGKWDVESNPCAISEQNGCHTNLLNYPGLKLPPKKYFETDSSFAVICEEGYQKTFSKNRISCFNGKWDVESNPCTISDQNGCYTIWLNYPRLKLPEAQYFENYESFEIRCEEGYRKSSSKNRISCFNGKWEVESNPCTISDQIGHVVPDVELQPVRQNHFDNEKHLTTTEAPSSSTPSTDTCYCTYDFPPDLVVAYSGNRPVDAKSVIRKGETVTLSCRYAGMNIVWRSGLYFYGSIINLTCDTCKNWSLSDLPTCKTPEAADSFLHPTGDMKILPGGIVEISRHKNVTFHCINFFAQPSWNPLGISGTHVSTVLANGHYSTYLQIIEATDSHAGVYDCYASTSNIVHTPTKLILEIADFEIPCPLLEDNTNRRIFNIQYESNRRVHSVAKYACKSRTQKLLGTSSRECLPNGQWSGSNPSCEDITCERILTYNSLVVAYTDGNKMNSVATFRCGRNAKLIGKNSTICMPNGKWSNPKPTCENAYASCDLFEKSENLEVFYDSDVRVGSSAIFSCVSPYKLVGNYRATCLQNGTWSRPLPSCEVPKCSIDSLFQSLPEDVSADLRNVTEEYVTYDTELQLVCNSGLFLSGSSKTKCGQKETWEHGNVRCIKACVLGETTSRLKVEPLKDHYLFSESIKLWCPPGQKLSSETQRVMCIGPSWLPPIPDCVDAPEANPQNGSKGKKDN